MPQQHRSQKHAPKPPAVAGKRGDAAGGRQQGAAGAAHASQEAAAANPEWQRGQGGFSAKAKKEYLQWKRQQKAAARDENGSDDDGGGGDRQQGSRNSNSNNSQHRAAAGDSTPANLPRPPRQQQQQQLSSTALLCYRPLVAVPATPFCASQPVAAAAGAASQAGGPGPGEPDSCTAYMPRLDPAEVGFTPDGFALDMPTRPNWRGVVRSAEQLHALEERRFDAWQAGLLAAATAGQHAAAAPPSSSTGIPQQQQERQEREECSVPQVMPGAGTARAGGVGRLSFYEGRLEFWRQLWRTLELSDVVCLIVDARNPLLHFSHALYRHVTQHHRLPLLLLLNKCDLVPAAAAAAWKQWLQQQLPGVVVVPVSAAPDQAPAAARAVLEAVMKLRVERGGQRVSVADVVGDSVDEIIEASIARNTHAKRHIMQQQQQTQQGAAAEEDDAAAAADAAAALAASEAEGGGSGAEEGGDWSLKPTRAARKAGRGAHRRRGQQQQQQQQQQTRPVHSSEQPLAKAKNADEGDASAAGPDSSDDDGDACSSDGGNSSDGNSSSSSSSSPELRQLSTQLDALTVEAQLSATAAAAAAAQPADNPAAAGSGTSNTRSAGGSSSDWRLDSRPVVIGLLGEPNVGKSSTLNVLLGSHRVSVSAHPGRTKHYQTHFMGQRLVLCDCPGIVFPRLDVSLPMQVLFGSYPIANCRDLAAVVAYLAASSWPRLQDRLGLSQPDQPQGQQQQQQQTGCDAPRPGAVDGGSDGWSAVSLCEALAAKRHWVLPRSGRLDTYRAANWLLRAALAGKGGLGLGFLPPRDEFRAGARGDAAAS